MTVAEKCPGSETRPIMISIKPDSAGNKISVGLCYVCEKFIRLELTGTDARGYGYYPILKIHEKTP